ncbi:nuclear pore complex protein NUP58-like [Impatiens glandulifera]|uniref:nuclear pore complex protein NUP58-like n=1 Tax=Impatiens glandulifera TaxID=253017 RepID=UPI001FB08590|nr:nuclear pore complex protein NUP58-like [Impatiens glandulifera]
MSLPFTPHQQSDQQQQPFTPKQSSSFQQSSPFSFTPQQHSDQQRQLFTPQQSSPFQQTVQQHVQLQQFQHQKQQQHQLYLFTNDRDPATYSTKWTDLHPDSQKLLLQIEETILEHWDESQRLDQCSRLYDSSVSSDGFESGASLIVQELGGISTSMEQQKAVIQELMGVVKDMLHNTEVAVRSFLMLQPKFLHTTSNGAPNTSATIQASGGTGQLMTTAIVPIFDFYSGVPRKPSPFLQQTVARFDKYLVELHRLIEELEQLLIVDTDINGINSSSLLLQALPKVMSNVHDFFVHVAAKVESIHQSIESMRTVYIADHRRQGLYNDPFLEANRRETAKEKVAAKRVHPTLHLPAFSQPSTKVSGLTTTVPTDPETNVAASSTSKSSLFATPSAETSSSPLFSTPATAASSSSLFGGSLTPVQTSLFGASTRTLSGTSLFGSTPSVAASIFSTPFASGIFFNFDLLCKLWIPWLQLNVILALLC